MIAINNVSKHYVVLDSKPQNVLHNVSLNISAGQFVAVVGPSGNGKSTLLNLIAGIDRPSSGEVCIDGAPIHKMSEDKLARWRGSNLGIVFQFFQLLPTLNLLQNVILPMDFCNKITKRLRIQRAQELLVTMGLEKEMYRLPNQVSGGQQQRAAIARALANDPPLLVADEPTGNLDETTANEVFGLFKELSNRGKTLIMVTHNQALAESASRKITLVGGKIHTDSDHNLAVF